MICKVCGEQFSPGKNHPGYINVCLEGDCRQQARSYEPPIYVETGDVSVIVQRKKLKAKQAGRNDGDQLVYLN